MTQALDKPKFMEWLTVLSEQCRQPLTTPSIAAYYAYFNGKISTEQFLKSAESLFEQGCDRLPSPIEWVKLARNLTPDLALPAAPMPPTFSELDEGQKAVALEAIRRAKELVMSGGANSRSGLTAIGAALTVAKQEVQAQKKRSQLERYRAWLRDDCLRQEAIAWAFQQEDVEMILDDLGEIVDLRSTAEVVQAGAP